MGSLWFRDLQLSAKQGVGFGMILLIMATAIMYGLNQNGNVTNEITAINENWLRRVVTISDINEAVGALRMTQLQDAVALDEQTRTKHRETMVSLIESTETNIDVYEQLRADTLFLDANVQVLNSADEATFYDEFDALWEQYLDISFLFLDLVETGQQNYAIAILNGEARLIFEDISQTLGELVRINRERATEAGERAVATYRSTRGVIIIVFLGTIFASALIAGVLVRYITVPVKEVEKAALRVSEGDLNVKLHIISHDEIGNLAYAFNKMTTSLRDAREMMQQQAEQLQQKNEDLEAALQRVSETQQQLVLSEKMASLGQLTAGIAHEIKNPLNFVNNFAILSIDLTEEIEEELAAHKDSKVAEVLVDVADLLADLKFNAKKINEHGARADSIVKGMLQHSRGAKTQREPTDLNQLVDEYINLTYHGMRASHADFNVTMEKDFDPNVGEVTIVPQEIGRVLINLMNNACYAVYERAKVSQNGFQPWLRLTTKAEGDQIVIQVSDNGGGIPEKLQGRVFEPFFTTKPTGSGTGLGLSLSYEIVTLGHNGTLSFESKEGNGTIFTVTLPRTPALSA